MNRWKIPAWLETEVRARDVRCVYCGVVFTSPRAGTRGTVATWEHIVNDARIVTPANIARCCGSCNASKGTKDLSTWLSSPYCRRRGITEDTVAGVVRRALFAPPQLPLPGA
jgi:hypothetical protein